MLKKENVYETSKNTAEQLSKITNERIEKLGEKSADLVETLISLQLVFDKIRGCSREDVIKLKEIKDQRINWIKQADKIESNMKNIEIKVTSAGVAGAGTGVAVAALGPSAAMGIATTFGAASTGTAISTLSGAAATNAAIAWLGGGSVAAGGGGMVAGNAILFFTGPVGWSIAAVSILSSGTMIFKRINDRNRLEKIYATISGRDINSYRLSIVELNERINKMESENILLKEAKVEAEKYGEYYEEMSEEQQYNLMTFVNLMISTTQLIVTPIEGLQPIFTKNDLKNYLVENEITIDAKKEKLYLYLGNHLYNINLTDTDKRALWKAYKKNDEFMSFMELSKTDFELTDIENIYSAINGK